MIKRSSELSFELLEEESSTEQAKGSGMTGSRCERCEAENVYSSPTLHRVRVWRSKLVKAKLKPELSSFDMYLGLRTTEYRSYDMDGWMLLYLTPILLSHAGTARIYRYRYRYR